MDPSLKYILTSLAWGAGIVFIGSVGYAFARLGKRRDSSAAESKKRGERITELEGQMAVLKAEAVPIQAAFQAMLIAKLTHFHTPIVDALMKKLGPPSTLTGKDMKKLAVAMQKRKVEVDSKIDEEERIAAGMLIDAIKLTEIEHGRQTKAKTETLLVTKPVVDEQAEAKETKKKEI